MDLTPECDLGVESAFLPRGVTQGDIPLLIPLVSGSFGPQPVSSILQRGEQGIHSCFSAIMGAILPARTAGTMVATITTRMRSAVAARYDTKSVGSTP